MNPFEKLLNESIPLSKVRSKRLIRSSSGAYKIWKLDKFFQNKDRRLFPIELKLEDVLKNESSHIMNQINMFFQHTSQETSKYEIHSIIDYVNGYCTDDKNQKVKIGGILEKYEKEIEDLYTHKIRNEEGRVIKTEERFRKIKPLLKSFKEDELRKLKTLSKGLIVFSRHPYDIAGMSTDRHWKEMSCMRMKTVGIHYPSASCEGMNSKYIKGDIEHGSVVVYLVRDDERIKGEKVKLHRPLSRILCKPCMSDNDKKNILWTVGRIYGNNIPTFTEKVSEIVLKELNYDAKPDVKYSLVAGVYDDAGTDIPIGFKLDKGKYARGLARFNGEINEYLELESLNKLHHSDGTVFTQNTWFDDAGDYLQIKTKIICTFRNTSITDEELYTLRRRIQYVDTKFIKHLHYGHAGIVIDTIDNGNMELTINTTINITEMTEKINVENEIDMVMDNFYDGNYMYNEIDSNTINSIYLETKKLISDIKKETEEKEEKILQIKKKYNYDELKKEAEEHNKLTEKIRTKYSKNDNDLLSILNDPKQTTNNKMSYIFKWLGIDKNIYDNNKKFIEKLREYNLEIGRILSPYNPDRDKHQILVNRSDILYILETKLLKYKRDNMISLENNRELIQILFGKKSVLFYLDDDY